MGLKTIKEMINFNQASAWDDEVADRKYLTTRLLYTNIKPLDHAMQGLWPNDFVVLSAKTGAGKTELVSQIAMNVAMQKKKVDLFALEASRYEIQRRIKFKLLSTYYYKDTGLTNVSYSKWTRFQLDDVFAKYTDRLNEDLLLLREYLRIHYRQSTFDLGDFIKLYNYYTKDSELVLCDHAQFFDFDDSKDENKHVKDMTLKMYDMIQVCKVPLVLVSHLRKLDDKKAFPDISDIFGSSELTKKATRVVILCRGQYNNEANVFETVMRFEKNREESVVNIKTLFNLGLKQYSEKYQLGNIVNNEFVAFT